MQSEGNSQLNSCVLIRKHIILMEKVTESQTNVDDVNINQERANTGTELFAFATLRNLYSSFKTHSTETM